MYIIFERILQDFMKNDVKKQKRFRKKKNEKKK